MVSTNDMRPGQSILVDSQIYNILEYQHVKPGKGKAFVKTKLKNITSGGVVIKHLELMKKLNKLILINRNFNFYIKNLMIIFL
jgi:elongation factor P